MAKKKKYTKKFSSGSDGSGKFFRGKCTVAGIGKTHFAIVAPDDSTLEKVWNRVMEIPMDKSRIQSVKIYEDR